MKKVLLTAFAAMAFFAMTACNNNKATEAVDDTTAATEQCEKKCCEMTDSAACCQAKVEGAACENAEAKECCKKAEGQQCDKQCEKKCEKKCESAQ